MKLRAALTLLALVVPTLVLAEDHLIPAPANPAFKMGFTDKIGQKVARDVEVQNYDGSKVKIDQILSSGRPVFFLPQFYLCMGTCLSERESLTKVLTKFNKVNMVGGEEAPQVGKDFDVVIFGIDPNEGTKESSEVARNILEIYTKPDWFKVSEAKTPEEKKIRQEKNEQLLANAKRGFYFTTSSSIEEIRKVTDSLGFVFYYDPIDKIINHPAGAMVVTPDGRVSGYLYGVDFPSVQVKKELQAASANQLSTSVGEPILLGCISVDPKTGKRTLVIRNVLNVACVATLLGMVAWIASMNARTKKNSQIDLGDNDL